MGDMSTCCKSEWGQQHTCSLRKGRYWGPKLHEGFFFLPNCQRKKKSEQGNKGGGFKNYNGRMEIKSNAFFGSDRTQGTEEWLPHPHNRRSEDEQLSAIATSGDLLIPWNMTGPY